MFCLFSYLDDLLKSGVYMGTGEMPASTCATLKGAAIVNLGPEGLVLLKLPCFLLCNLLLIFSFATVSVTDWLSPEVQIVNTEQLPYCGDEGDS